MVRPSARAPCQVHTPNQTSPRCIEDDRHHPPLVIRGCYWPTLTADVRRWLANCPDCELEKARQSAAHGLFSARPYDAPRSGWAKDFQEQGRALARET
jgi:hypothetical protein